MKYFAFFLLFLVACGTGYAPVDSQQKIYSTYTYGCELLNCDPTDEVVANPATGLYYKCHCAYAQQTRSPYTKCFDTIKAARDAGYKPASGCGSISRW